VLELKSELRHKQIKAREVVPNPVVALSIVGLARQANHGYMSKDRPLGESLVRQRR
jgi:hypothetical protein